MEIKILHFILVQLNEKVICIISVSSGIEIPAVGPKRSARPLPSPISEENLDHMTPDKPLSQQFMNKLSQLEKLQYELTKQVGILVTHALLAPDMALQIV